MPSRADKVLPWASFVCALASGVALLFIPWGSSEAVTYVDQRSGQPIVIEPAQVTLLENEGAGVIPVLLLPALLAGGPLLARGRRRRRAYALIAAIGTTVLVVLGAMSIGLFFLPAAVLLWFSHARLRGQVHDRARSTRESYDRVAERYAEEFWDELTRKPFDQDLLADLAARWKGKGHVLDVGCGPGHITAHLAALGVDVAGVDLSPGMVEVARTRHPGLRFEVADMRQLPNGDHELAGIVAMYSVIHIAPGEMPDVIAEFRRVLADDGVLLVAGHAGEGTVEVKDFRGIAVDLEATWFEVEDLTAQLEHAGFEIEQATRRAPYEGEVTERIYIVARATA